MEYVAGFGQSQFVFGPSISDVPSVTETIKKIATSFVETLSLGKRDSLKSKLYEEYFALVAEKEKLTQRIAELELQISFLSDALLFVDCLSLELAFPSISGDADEDISLEWINASGEELIVTFKGNGKIVYSGIIDNGTVSGLANFKSKEIPKNIEALIKFFDR